MIFAVVPAAGHSTRMGRAKLALPLAGRTVIEHVVAALRAGGCDHVLVVVGPHVPELLAPAAKAGAHVCMLDEPTPDMRTTVEHGLHWLQDRFHPRPADGWFLAPGDHPALDAAVTRKLIAEYSCGKHSVLLPTCTGRRGHPALVAWKHVDDIRNHPANEGLNAFFRSLGEAVGEVPVDGDGVLHDLDTPEDYERVRAAFSVRA
jgi:CTP:molybdopterin cytidylyltransferase MocA